MIDYFIDALSMHIVPIYCVSINDDLTFETKFFVKSGLTYFTSTRNLFLSPEPQINLAWCGLEEQEKF